MSAGACLLDSSGQLILRDGGKVMLSDGVGDECCCGGGGTPLCYTVTGYEGRYHWGTPAEDVVPDPGGGRYKWWSNWPGRSARISCHKFLSWHGISVTSNTIPSSIGSPDHILHSRRSFSNAGAPFRVSGPTDPAELVDEPYWYAGCTVGGYATATIEHVPTGTQLNTMWGGAPVPNGTYKLLVGVTAWRHYKKAVGGGVEEIVSAANGRFKVTFLGLQAS